MKTAKQQLKREKAAYARGEPLHVDVVDNIFEALFDPPEATLLTLQSMLMMAIEKRVTSWDLSKAAAAKHLGVSKRRLRALLDINATSTDDLVKLAVRAGLTVRFDEAGLELEPDTSS